AAVEQNQRAIAGALPDQALAGLGSLFREHAEGLRGVAERSRPGENIGEGMPPSLDREGLAPARWHRDVEIARIGGNATPRSALAPELAADPPHAGPVVVDHLRDLAGGDVLIAWRGHLQRGRQIRPQLEAVHVPAGIALGHFLVENAAPGSHPLDVAGTK